MESLILLDPDGARARLLAVAGIVQDRLPTAVLIGGLAVVCRCQRHGRVTQDVDTVIDESVQGVELANLGSLEADGHVWIDGVKVDVVGVDALDSATPLTELVAGGRQQLFVAAHRWALDHHQVVNVTTTHGKARWLPWGGMIVPAAVYAAINSGGPGAGGWGIPMATDIAFALGVVAVLGRRVPSSLRIFLLTLAIVDDIGAILVIAVFYSSAIVWPALAGAAALLATTIGFRVARVTWLPAYVVVGVGMWFAFYESGVHATLAGVILGLLTPAKSDASEGTESVSVAERLQHQLHPLTSFVVVPLFALANAGVTFSGDALDAEGAGSVAFGIGAGLIGGKIIGIAGFTWLATRLGLGPLPRESTWPQVVGIAAVAGIGFTVSLFIAGLAFDDAALEAAAKIGILAASVLAAVVGVGLLLSARTEPESADLAPIAP